MKILYKKKVFNVHWPEKFDKILRRVAREYKLSNGYISWKDAEADGELKGIPLFLSLDDLSCRYSFIKLRETKKYQERRKELLEKYKKEGKLKTPRKKKTQYGVHPEKIKLFSDVIPEKIKMSHDWKPRSIWTKEQNNILNRLVKRYRKSIKTIDWIALAKDERTKKLPFRDSFKLCKYWKNYNRKTKPGFVEKHRKETLKYKHDNYDTYRKNQDRRRMAIQKSVNEFLLSKIPLR